MLLEINPDNPQPRFISQVVNILKNGGVIIYPTDTVYGIGCDIHNQKAIEKLCRIKGVKAEKRTFSFVFSDLKHIAEYAIIDNNVFKVLKSQLPGAYTFICKASSQVPKILKAKKKTIGIRIPDNNIIRDIVQELGNPILTTSVKTLDEEIEYSTDPFLMHEAYCKQLDCIVDGGIGGFEPSTVIDCTDEPFQLIREGAGEVDF